MFLNSFNDTGESRFKRISANMLKFKVFSKNNTEYNFGNDRTYFKWLYDNYASKVHGFITRHIDRKEEAEEYMMTVFLKVWENIKTFDHDAEKKIQQIVLLVCKPIFKYKYL